MNSVFGALIGLGLGLLLFDLAEGGDVISSIGDWWADLTTSEVERVNLLEPGTRAAVTSLVEQLRAEGVPIYIGQTRRTPAQEKALQESGKTSATLKVSWHELGRAVDAYPLLPNGKPDYEATNLDAFRVMHDRAIAMGFRSLAFNDDGSKRLITNSKGKKIWDGGHIEWRSPYGTIAEAVSSEGTDEMKGRVA